ncbi:MAG TPA: MFS transporter [Acidimicrobiales bacterium]|nr:MFS transporter [Acidimicrobiales bacterium]
MRIRSRAKHRIRRKKLGRPFWRLWTGFTVASSGDGMLAGAVPLLAIFVNPHPLAVSSVVAADRIPWLLLALPAGAFADKFSRGPLMAVSNLLRAAAIAVGAFLILGGHIGLATLIVIVLVNASGRAIYYSSLQAVIPDVVSSDALEYANGLLIGTETTAETLAGPIVGTWFYAMNKALPFFTDAVALVLSCIPFIGFHSKAPKSETSTPSVWEGVRILWDDRRLRYLILMVASLAGLQGMETGVLVLLATTLWGVSTGAYGLFLAVNAFGALLGSLAANRLVRRFQSAQTLIIAAVVSGIGYLVMAVAKGWPLAGSAYAVVGFAVGVGAVVSIALRQRLTPPEAMGRVGAASRGIVWGAAPVGALLAGSLAALGGLRVPLVLAGVLQCLVAALLARPLLHSLREDASQPL